MAMVGSDEACCCASLFWRSAQSEMVAPLCGCASLDPVRTFRELRPLPTTRGSALQVMLMMGRRGSTNVARIVDTAACMQARACKLSAGRLR